MLIWIHVETVVLLSHTLKSVLQKPDSHINIKVDFGEEPEEVPIANIEDNAESHTNKRKGTYKNIISYIEAKYGFKVHTAYIAEVKRGLGLPMYDAPNGVEELKHPRRHPTPEKVKTRVPKS